jgi:hypothetical protein
VSAAVSSRCPEPQGRFPRVTHPCAAPPEGGARLACVRRAASVRSEPGSNSQLHPGTNWHKRSKLRPSRSAETNPPNLKDPPEDAQTAPPPPEHPLTTTTYHVKEQRLTATVPKRLPEACASRPPVVGVSTGTSAEPRIYAYSPAAASPFFTRCPQTAAAGSRDRTAGEQA